MVKKTIPKGNKKGAAPKKISKNIVPGSKSTEVVYHSTKEIKVEKELIDNFIGLQRVMVNLSNKFDNLSTQISKLLDVFEISAKALARKELSSSNDPEMKKILDKLENISKQAGLIGKGLALIHEVGTENERPVIPLNLQKSKPLGTSNPLQPGFPKPEIPTSHLSEKMTDNQMKMELTGFQKSIAHREDKPENA